jgi:hypothetical protein
VCGYLHPPPHSFSVLPAPIHPAYDKPRFLKALFQTQQIVEIDEKK